MNKVFWVLLIGLAGLGTMNDIKTKQAWQICRSKQIEDGVPHYNLLLTLLAGLGIIIALVGGIISEVSGVVGGLILAVIVTLPYLKSANDDIRLLKKAGWSSQKMLTFSPTWIWGRVVLLGMGKWIHILFCCTLIGIPLYRMMEQVTINMDKLIEQIELRKEYEALNRHE